MRDSKTGTSGSQPVDKVVDEVYPELREANFDARTFSTDGGYIANDWSVNPNGEDYVRRYGAFDGPAFRAGMDKLAYRLDR